METAVVLSDAGKRYGSHWVLSGLNLSIRRGETVAVFGKNGSGKSTLLKMIATLVAPSTGRVTVLGQDIQKEKAAIRERVRMLGHEKQLYESLTAEENLRLAADLIGIPPGECASKIRSVLDGLAIARFANHRVDRLSEGTKKRVVLGRLLLSEDRTDLLLLDEPHPTLDDEGRGLLDGFIGDWKKQGKTILLSSHDHAQALQHAERLLIIENGTIGYDGAPK